MMLVMREIDKLGPNVSFARKHYFPKTPVLKGQGFSKIQAHLGNLKWDHILKEVLFNCLFASPQHELGRSTS